MSKEVNYNKASGEIIREARLAKNLTEQDLAYAIDPENYIEVTKLIKYWERGNGFPNLDQLYKLSEVIDVNVNEIQYYKDNENKKVIEKRKKRPMTIKEYNRKRYLETIMEDLEDLFPVIVYFIIFLFILVGPSRVAIGLVKFFKGIIFNIISFFKGVK